MTENLSNGSRPGLGEGACETLSRFRWGLLLVGPLTDGETEQSGEFGGRLNQVTSGFGPSQPN